MVRRQKVADFVIDFDRAVRGPIEGEEDQPRTQCCQRSVGGSPLLSVADHARAFDGRQQRDGAET